MMKSENTDQRSKSSNAFKSAHSSFPSKKSNSKVSSPPHHDGFDVKKLQKRLKMSVDKEKQFSELMESTARVMATNAIQNILYVKEAMGKDKDKKEQLHKEKDEAIQKEIEEKEAEQKRLIEEVKRAHEREMQEVARENTKETGAQSEHEDASKKKKKKVKLLKSLVNIQLVKVVMKLM